MAAENPPAEAEPVLAIHDLAVSVGAGGGRVRAVDGVSLAVRSGEALGLVGESGSGKSLTCLSILRVLPPGARIEGGEIRLNGVDLVRLPDARMRQVRAREARMILQDPLTSLNPVLTVGDQLAEAFRLAGRAQKGSALREQVVRALEEVRIPAARSRLASYPHQLSGGMRQRVAAAIALAASPLLLIADEPTTALDVSVQDEFLRLLVQLQQDHRMALLLVSHDLGVVASTCDRVAVMYAGRIVETGPVDAVFGRPSHPYTRALLRAAPTFDGMDRGQAGELYQIAGEAPDPLRRPGACRFAPRCEFAMPICRERDPPETEGGDGARRACWLHVPPYADAA